MEWNDFKYTIPQECLWQLKQKSGDVTHGISSVNSGLTGIRRENYKKIAKLVLFMEEAQARKEAGKYTALNANTSRTQDGKAKVGPFHNGITLPRINEEIRLTDNTKKQRIRATVVRQGENHVILEHCNLGETEGAPIKYKLRVPFRNHPFKCRHFALKNLDEHVITETLFPERKARRPDTGPTLEWINKKIVENAEQQRAVKKIVSKSAFPASFILFGPPGTGKSETIVEAICQIHNNTNARILVCATSNAAVDIISLKLLQYMNQEEIMRIYSPTRDGTKVNKAILPCSNILNGRVTNVKLGGITR